MSDDKPITTEDLYGKSESTSTQSPNPQEAPAEVPKAPPVEIPIEETPEIEPIPDPVPVEAPAPPVAPPPAPLTHPPMPTATHPSLMPPKHHSGSIAGPFGTIIIFVILFITGIWLSTFLRQYLPSDFGTATPTPTPLAQITPSLKESVPLSVGTDSYTSWKTYEVISGVTRLPIAGVRYKLPSEVLSPICDSAGCASQGTYLPGGTRFTVAPRGAGQILRDSRGAAISDVGGITFTTKKVTVAGRPATEFTGVFTGKTISGYVFSRMRGVMIEISDSLSLEVNHFTPNGITADFQKDEALFDAILKTITFSDAQTKGGILPTLTPTKTATVTGVLVPTGTPSATPTRSQ